MEIDRYSAFSLDQDLGAVAVGTEESTNSLKNTRGNAQGDELYLVGIVKEAFASAGAATVQFQLEADDDSAFGGTDVLWDSGAIPKATLVAGYRIVQMRLPRAAHGNDAYLRMLYTVAVADLTAGKVDFFLTTNPQDNDPRNW